MRNIKISRSAITVLCVVIGLGLAGSAGSVQAQPVPAVSDTLIDFGSVPFSSNSVKPFWVRNTGDATLIVTAILNTDPSHYTVSPTVFAVAAGDSQQVDVTFTPITVATFNATLTVVSFNAQPDSIDIELTGMGAPAVPIISVSADTIAVTVQEFATRDTTVTVSNLGGGQLIWSIPGGPNFSFEWYHFVPWTLTQAGGTFADVTVTFDPQAFGQLPGQTYYETVTFESNDLSNPSVPLVLAMTVIPGPPQPSIDVNGSTSFSSFVGVPDVNTLTVVNNGSEDTLHVTDILLFDSQFSVSEKVFDVPPDDQHQITMTFLPTQVGQLFGVTTFVSDDPVQPFFSRQTIADADLPPIANIPTDSIKVTLPSGQSTSGQTVSIGNTGTGANLTWSLGISGLPNGAVTAGPLVGSVPAGSNQITTLTFDAVSMLPGDYPYTLRFSTNDPATPLVNVPVLLHVDPALAIDVTPTSLDFDTLIVAQTSLLAVTLTNTASDTVVVDSATVAGPAFTVGALPGPIANGQNAQLGVTFDPPAAGTWLDTLKVYSNADPGVPVVVPLVGVALAATPAVTLTQSVVDLGGVYVNLTAAAVVGVTNTGTGPLAISSVTSSQSAFMTGAWPDTVDVGGSFPLALAFTPQTTGLANAVININSNAPGSPTPIAVSGLGQSGDVSLAPSNPSVTLITDGQGQAFADITNAGAVDFDYDARLYDVSAPMAVAAAKTGGVRSAAAVPPVIATPVYFDNFEDGDFNGWIETPGASSVRIVGAGGADGSDKRFIETDSPFGHQSGIYALLPAVQPTEASFWVRPGQDDLFSTYVTLRDAANTEVIFFFAMSTGVFYCNASTGGDATVPYVTNQWYHIEYRNMDWTAKTFDYYVDDALVSSGVSFRNPTLINEVSRIDLYSFASGAGASWDNIWLSWGTDAGFVSASPTPGNVPTGRSFPVELSFDATALADGTYDALLALSSGDAVAPVVTVPVTLTVDNTPTGTGNPPGIPEETALYPNQPNPFNPVTTIRYDLPVASAVSLSIYDVRGARVRTLISGVVDPGRRTITWNGTDDRGRRVASGVYLYRLQADGFSQTRKMLLLK